MKSLEMKATEINDLLSFKYIASPLPQALDSAMYRLYSLGALDEEGSRDESRNANGRVPTGSFSQVWNSVAATKP